MQKEIKDTEINLQIDVNQMNIHMALISCILPDKVNFHLYG